MSVYSKKHAKSIMERPRFSKLPRPIAAAFGLGEETLVVFLRSFREACPFRVRCKVPRTALYIIIVYKDIKETQGCVKRTRMPKNH